MKIKQLFLSILVFSSFYININSTMYTQATCKDFLSSNENVSQLDYYCNNEDLKILAISFSTMYEQDLIFKLDNKKLDEILLLNHRLDSKVAKQINLKYKSNKLIQALVMLEKEKWQNIKKHDFVKAEALIKIINYYEAEDDEMRKKLILNKIKYELEKNKTYFISVNKIKVNRYLSILSNISTEDLSMIKGNNVYHKDIETDMNIINNINISQAMIKKYLRYENFYIKSLAEEKTKLKQEKWKLKKII